MNTRQQFYDKARQAIGGLYVWGAQGHVPEELPDKQRNVVQAYYLNGYSMADLSGLIGCSIEKAEQIKRVGIKALRRNTKLRLLWMEYEAAAFATRTYSAWKNTHTSAVEAGAVRREQLRKSVAGQLRNRYVTNL